MSRFRFIVEQHADGFVAYPLGLKGVVVGQGETSDEALADAKSAVRFHVQTFGPDALDNDSSLLDAFLVEAGLDA